MSYNSTTKIISRTSSVSVSDVQSAIGNTSTDLGTLCKAASVNKWSKDKPYRYAKIGPLSRIADTMAGTIDERRGSLSDIANGIMWGMRFRGLETGMLKGLHDADYSYIKPLGGTESPYRLTDFQGYYHGAACNLQASVDHPSQLLVGSATNTNRQITVNFNYTDGLSNDYQILIEDFDSNLNLTSNKITTWYPCILIGRYAHCLYKKKSILMTQTRTAETLGNQVQWFIDLGSRAQSSTDGTAYPGPTEGSVKASVFLVPSSGISSFNTQTSWFDATGNGGQIMPSNTSIIAVPGAVGINVPLEAAYNMTVLAVVNGRNVNVSVRNNDSASRTIKVTCDSLSDPAIGRASSDSHAIAGGQTWNTVLSPSGFIGGMGAQFEVTVWTTNTNKAVASTIATSF